LAYKVRFKNSQAEFMITPAKKYQATFYVADEYTKGLKSCTFAAVKDDGTSNGKSETTLTYAGAVAKTYGAGVLADGAITLPAKKASGIIYDSSTIDQFGREDNFSNEENLFPFGNREDKSMGLVKKGVIEITDTAGTKINIFNTKKSTLGVPASQTDTTITYVGNKTALVKAGDKILNTETAYVVSAVFGGVNTVITVNSDATLGVVATETFTVGQIDDPVYLADDMSGDLPFTTIPPVSGSGKLKQIVGYIENAISVRVDLTIDVNPSTV